LEWVTTCPFAPLGARRLKYFTCSGSYVGQGGVATPRGMVRSRNFMGASLRHNGMDFIYREGAKNAKN
jgi:hypothetical protein